VCRKITQGGKVPDRFKLGYVSSIHRKGDRRICSSYRGTCVTNSIIKTFGKVIKYGLENEYINVEEQCDFTTGRSCADHNFKLMQIVQNCQDKPKQIGLVFIDVEKHMTAFQGSYCDRY
jgi:hypothetical protein